MPTFRKSHHVPLTPDQMFAVVADVERYPEFLPLCDGLRVREKNVVGDETHLVATMKVGYKGINEAFTTRVRIAPATREIDVTYVDGPFRHLINEWRFVPTDSGTNIKFYIDYEFRSVMLSLIAGAAFERAVMSYTRAFENRARSIYVTPDAATA